MTCVPANSVQTSKLLPRSNMEGSLLWVKSKHQLMYKGHHEDQFVDTMRPEETNVYYKDIAFVENMNMRLLKRRLIVTQKVRKHLQKVRKHPQKEGKHLQMLLKMCFWMIGSGIVSFRTRSLQRECLISTGIDFEGGP